jgi:hypothetical protein
MAEASNTEQDSRDVRQNDNIESILEDGRKDGNTAELPSSNTSEPAKGQSSGQEEEQPKKPSKLKQIWAKLGLDPVTLIMMFKSVYTTHSLILLLITHEADMRAKGFTASHDSCSLVSVD